MVAAAAEALINSSCKVPCSWAFQIHEAFLFEIKLGLAFPKTLYLTHTVRRADQPHKENAPFPFCVQRRGPGSALWSGYRRLGNECSLELSSLTSLIAFDSHHFPPPVLRATQVNPMWWGKSGDPHDRRGS